MTANRLQNSVQGNKVVHGHHKYLIDSGQFNIPKQQINMSTITQGGVQNNAEFQYDPLLSNQMVNKTYEIMPIQSKNMPLSAKNQSMNVGHQMLFNNQNELNQNANGKILVGAKLISKQGKNGTQLFLP